MKIRFWGVRGAFAMTGARFLRYGGNTTAVEFMTDGGRRLLVDMGTGVAELAKTLMATEFGRGRGELPILVTHTHLAHIQGLPFFSPFFVKGNRIDILGSDPIGTTLEQVFQTQLNPHYSPLNGLGNLAAGVKVHAIGPGSSLPVEGFEVAAAALPHGGMWSMGFRIRADGKSVAFLTDVEYPETGPTADALALANGVDLLVHDAMYTDEEYVERRGWGHSAVASAIEVAERAGVGELVLFHHNTDATDEAVDDTVIRARQKTVIPLFAAAEGSYLQV